MRRAPPHVRELVRLIRGPFPAKDVPTARVVDEGGHFREAASYRLARHHYRLSTAQARMIMQFAESNCNARPEQ